MRRGPVVVAFFALVGLTLPLLVGRGAEPRKGAASAAMAAAPPRALASRDAAPHANEASPPTRESPADEVPDADRTEAPLPACAEGDAICACEQRLFRPLGRTFIGRAPDAPAEPPIKGEAGHSPLFKDVARRLRGRFQPRPDDLTFAIAIVPDPSDSAQYYRMDRMIEAIRNGVESSSRAPGQKWVPDRFWLPWNDVHAESETERRAIAECRSLVPGVLLFRDEGLPSNTASGQPMPLLALLVVGETPTWGLHKEPLTEALDLIEAATPRGRRERRTVPVIGPSFSSTPAGLRYALTSWLNAGQREGTCFDITSGSATSVNNQTFLDACGGRECGACEGPVKIRFKATTLPSTALQSRMYGYLHQRGGITARGDGEHPCALRGVALLVESGTTFGQSIEERHGERVTRGKAEATRTCDGFEPDLVLPFPLHVSSVRREYETELRAKTPADPAYEKQLALNPTFDEPTAPIDLYPNGSPRTIGSNDLILTAIFNELARRDVQYIGIVATDRADVIFLAHHARAHYPNARLFTFGTDAFFTHPSVTADVEGMLVASPYPLFGRDQAWREDRQYLTFAGDYDEGTYNATVAALGRADRMVDYDDGGTLPTWIAAVGHGGMWALERTAESADPTGYALRRPAIARTPLRVRATRSWRLVLFVLFVFCACNIFAYWLARHREPASWWHRWTLRRFYLSSFRGQMVGFTMLQSVAPTSTYFASYSYYRLATMLVLFVSGGTLLAIETLALRLDAPDGERRMVVAFFVAGVLVELLLLLCCVDAFVSWARCAIKARGDLAAPSRPGETLGFVERRVRNARGLVVVLVAAVVILLWCLEIAPTGPLTSAALHYDRLTSLGSGTSILTPILLVSGGFYFWAICHLERRRLLDGLQTKDAPRWRWLYALLGVEGDAPDSHGDSILPPAPPSMEDPTARTSHAAREADRHENVVARVLRLLGTPHAELIHRVLQALLLATPAYLFVIMKPIRTLEGCYGEWLVWVVFGAWLVISVSGVIWLLLLWYRFRLLLRRLARHPLVDAYGRLPSAVVSTLEKQVSGIVPGTMELAVSVEQLQRLTRHAGRILAGPRGDGDRPSELRETLGRIYPDLVRFECDATRGLASDMQKLGNRDAPLGPYLSEVQPPLAEAASVVNEALVVFWDARPPGVMKESLRAAGVAPGVDSLTIYSQAVTEDEALWARLGEAFLATQVTLFLYQLMRHFRLFLTLITASALLLLLALASYAFQPRHLLMSTLWVVILSSAALALTVLVQMSQDELLSRISKTEPGKVDLLDRAFLFRVLTWAVVPILSLLAVQYPEVASGLFEGVTSFAR